MTGVSWAIGPPVPPMPYRSLVDGSPVQDMTPLPMPRFTPGVIWVPLDPASRERFQRYARRRNFVWLGACFSMIAAIPAFLRWADAHLPGGFVTAMVLFVGVALLLRFVLDRLRPAQYPHPRRRRMLVRNVHPDTIREWELVAGDALRVD